MVDAAVGSWVPSVGKASKDGDPGRQAASVDGGVGVCVAVDFDPGVSTEVKTGQERAARRALELESGFRQGPVSKLLEPWAIN